MDVLEYYMPDIDWQRFRQGPISDDVWSEFRDVLQLCHAYKHWKDVARVTRRSRPSSSSLDRESAYQRRKNREEWKYQIEQDEGHMYRAAYLAAEKIWAIAGMMEGRQDTPDWHFSLALVNSVGLRAGTDTDYERANFDVLAFDEFDADAEVSSDPGAMASRWRDAAGYREGG